MALKLSGPLAPGVSHAKPVTKKTRLCTGANPTTVTDMAVIVDFAVGLKVSAAEADLYLHWAGDLLDSEKDDDDGRS